MLFINESPTKRIGDLEYGPGHVLPLGATLMFDGVNFSVFSKEATSCTLVLYHHGQKVPFQEIPFPDSFRIGHVYSMMVYGLNIETIEYGYRFDGPYDPKKGLRFDKNRVLLDPFARSISGRSVWGIEPDYTNPFQYRGQIIREDYDWLGDKPLEMHPSDLVIYELHLRSFTQHPASEVRYRGTYAGLIEKIPYLKALGVNCVELMPIFEFDEFENSREVNGRRLVNYWGYSTVGFLAPKAGYAASARFGMEADELRHMIRTLHQNGIQVILDVVFNHTAEGGEGGPSISFKGIDNRTYYLLTPDGGYINYSGCGNTMNCNNPVVRNLMLGCLIYWVAAFHVDGFRFDLASILSRDEKGVPMMNPPLLESIACDEVLGKTLLIAEAWDAGGLYQVGTFPAYGRWSEWNGMYRDCLRRFIKGEAERLPELILRIRGSDDLYRQRGPTASINFVTCHDGFTLYDLVSYNEKHNWDNGEENRDGTNDNASWNCGAEGSTDDPEIIALRMRQMKNMLTVLFTSRGIPMLLSGDEYLYDYVRRLIAFRKAHPVLRADGYDFSHNGTGYPELSFHGTQAWNLDEHSPGLSFAYMYAEDHVRYCTERDAFIYVAVNAYWETQHYGLPILPEGFQWGLAFESHDVSTYVNDERPLEDQSGIVLGPRSAAVLIGSMHLLPRLEEGCSTV